MVVNTQYLHQIDPCLFMEKKADSKKKQSRIINEQNTVDHEQQAQAPDILSPEPQLEGNNDSINLVNDRIMELEAKLAEANEKHLRLFSEFDNYRKRSTRERIELSKTASADMITALLPVVDDLERACALAGAETAENAVAEGIKLIYSKLKTVLAQKGVEEINAVGQDFNTDFHEALTHIQASNNNEKGKVVDQVQKGYMLNGKVIRFARVVVAK